MRFATLRRHNQVIKTTTMLALVMILWHPMEPARHVTATLLHTVADLIHN
jgi:hypothetical protein